MEVQDLKSRLGAAQLEISQLQRDKAGLTREHHEIAKRHAHLEITKDPNKEEYRILATVEYSLWRQCDNALKGELLLQLVEQFARPNATPFVPGPTR